MRTGIEIYVTYVGINVYDHDRFDSGYVEQMDGEDGFNDLIDLWVKRAKRHAEEDAE